MQLLSVVGIKTREGRRAAIVQSSYSRSNAWIPGIFKQIHKTIFLLTCVSILIYLQVREFTPLVVAQNAVVEFLNPVTNFLSRPFQLYTHIQTYFQQKDELITQIESLKLQNDHLLRVQQQTQQAVSENIKLRTALRVQDDVVDDMITVQLSHHTFDGYSKLFYTKVSSLESVVKNDPVLTTTGFLAGRVTSVGRGVGAKNMKLTCVMPITDPASRIPVKIQGTDHHAILKGKGDGICELIYMENPGQVELDQKLVTSGVGGIFPAEIPVASITHVGTSILAKPLGQLKDQAFALILTQTPPQN